MTKFSFPKLEKLTSNLFYFDINPETLFNNDWEIHHKTLKKYFKS